MKNKTIALTLGAVLLVAATAGASVLVMNNKTDAPVERTATTSNKTIHWNDPAPKSTPAHTTAACNDGNVAGKVVGGVGGGVLGSMVGKGKGKTAATIGGTLGGAYIGGETIPLNNVTCPR